VAIIGYTEHAEVQSTDVQVHGGDETLFLLKGTLNLLLPEHNGQQWLELAPWNGFYVPEETPVPQLLGPSGRVAFRGCAPLRTGRGRVAFFIVRHDDYLSQAGSGTGGEGRASVPPAESPIPSTPGANLIFRTVPIVNFWELVSRWLTRRTVASVHSDRGSLEARRCARLGGGPKGAEVASRWYAS